MTFRHLLVAALAAVGLSAATASASIIETEPNDTLAEANAITITRTGGIWADAGVLSLDATAEDVDFFSLDLLADEALTLTTTPLGSSDFGDPDTMLGIFDGQGTLLDYTDDTDGSLTTTGDDSGLGSTLRFHASETGTYYVAVTGFNDANFNGIEDNDTIGHGETGLYVLTASVVPEPASLALMLIGGTMLGWRRRRSA
ncbi:MAG: DVUA0089 family protein [Phycisphaeraceae bacterium]